jgi:hypothetical protein
MTKAKDGQYSINHLVYCSPRGFRSQPADEQEQVVQRLSETVWTMIRDGLATHDETEQ